VHYCALNSISDVFHSVSPTVQLALLPQENSIFGIVTETYDLLRSPDVGESRWVRGAVTLPIQHCLMVRRGKTLRNIKKVLSHEQALGQCQRFLAAHLPEAQLVSVASTAAAAEAVSKQVDTTTDCAAICSKICLQLFAGLELLYEGIQNEHREPCPRPLRRRAEFVRKFHSILCPRESSFVAIAQYSDQWAWRTQCVDPHGTAAKGRIKHHVARLATSHNYRLAGRTPSARCPHRSTPVGPARAVRKRVPCRSDRRQSVQ